MLAHVTEYINVVYELQPDPLQQTLSITTAHYMIYGTFVFNSRFSWHKTVLLMMS